MTAGVLPLLAAAWYLLGQQGARLGSFPVPALSAWWVLAAVAANFLIARRGPRVAGARLALEAAALALAFVALAFLRHASLVPALELMASVEDGGRVRLTRIQIPERRDLRRLTGRRRNLRFEARAVLEVPRDGRYRFELYCDDACDIDVGEHHLRAVGALEEELQLASGDLPFVLRYRQAGGPASLRVGWTRPALVELLPIDYYLRAPGAPARSRFAAVAGLGGMLLWWAAFSIYVVRLSRSRAALSGQRWVPAAAATVIVLYGGALRFEAFLAHSSLAVTSPRWADVHEALLPWMPPYAVFNPENAPDDPYRADVRSYLDRAFEMSFTSFYAPSFREPFYVALNEPFLALAGGELGILVQSLFFSIALLVLFALVAARLYGGLWAVLLLVPIALHEWLVLEAPTGYRMSAYAFFLLLVAALTSFVPGREVRAAAAGALAGLLCLIRLSALSAVLPLLGLRVLREERSRRFRWGGLYALALLVVVLPFLFSNYRAHGDPLYSVSFHTEFWLRAEGLDPRSGPVSLTRYFTDFGRTWRVVKGSFLGMTAFPVRTFWNGLRHFLPLDAVVIPLGLAGLLAGIRSRGFLLAAYFGHLLPFAYIQTFPSGEMPRFVMPAFLFLVLAVPEGFRASKRLFRGLGHVPRADLIL